VTYGVKMMSTDNTSINLEILFKLISELQHRIIKLEEQQGKLDLLEQSTEAYIKAHWPNNDGVMYERD
jgi:hypothetical protein